VYVTGKIGVGSGIIVDGKLLTGARGFAGEVGHMLLDPSGPPCRCGSRGCVETYVGEAALLRLAGRTAPPTRESVAEVLRAARAGEPAALNGVRAVAISMGRTVANLVNVLNPQAVIMGGSLAAVLELCRPEVEAELARHAMSDARRSVELRTAGLGDDSSLLGAAELAFGPLLADPVGAELVKSA
jgi:predicted NBD/HSP70 family sugar kinase